MRAYDKLAAKQAEIARLSNVLSISQWDSATYLPSASAAKRIEENSELTKFIHLHKTSDKFCNLLDAALDEKEKLSATERRNIELIKKDFDDSQLIPADMLAKHSHLTGKCEYQWRSLRQQNDFNSLAPYLDEVFKSTREIAQLKADYYGIDSYEALVDDYDPGRKLGEIENVMQATKQALPKLIQKISQQQLNHTSRPINNEVTPQIQLAISNRLAETMGFDFSRGRIDQTTHPFCGGTRDDVRLTTKFIPSDMMFGLYGVIHETGHGLYQQNLPSQYDYQPVGSHFGMSFHESQSVIMEANIGSSLPFCRMLSNLLQHEFALSGPEYSAENIYAVKNNVTPSLIRIEADEVTYPMHIVLRYELEREIIDGTIKAADLPSAWNKKMREYLGITPDSNANGCMQDIHWHTGFFGYFPSYYMGSIIASMVMKKMETKLPNINNDIAGGNFSAINNYLNDNFRKLGKTCTSSELLEKASGCSQIDPNCFFDYISKKHSQ